MRSLKTNSAKLLLSFSLALSFSLSLEAAEPDKGVSERISGPAMLDESSDGRGWFWYKDEKKKDEPIVYEVPEEKPEEKKEEEKEEEKEPEKDCSKPDEWDESCGFVHPGSDFDFQAKQRDVLLKGMVMNSGDQKSVENFQYYMKWMVQNALQAARTWQFNKIQNPDLDPQALYPTSYVGLQMASKMKSGKAKEVFKYIAENGTLFYFTKASCKYCHEMAPWVLDVAKDTGIEIWNAALDENCLEGFDNCVIAPETISVAQALEVKVVPALYIFIDPDVHIRVASGLTSKRQIRGRIVNYFSAYRAAAMKGINNGDRWKASTDFSFDNKDALGSGFVDEPDEPVEKSVADEFSKKFKDM
jgi:conjugal transfer pilus assembly protein TraF